MAYTENPNFITGIFIFTILIPFIFMGSDCMQENKCSVASRAKDHNLYTINYNREQKPREQATSNSPTTHHIQHLHPIFKHLWILSGYLVRSFINSIGHSKKIALSFHSRQLADMAVLRDCHRALESFMQNNHNSMDMQKHVLIFKYLNNCNTHRKLNNAV